MKLIAIQFDPEYHYTAEEQVQAQLAYVWGDYSGKIRFKEDGSIDNSWTEFLMDAALMPAVPHRLIRVVRSEAPLGLDTDTAARVPAFNQKVHVTVPGLGLLLLDEVTVETNICTDALNDLLKEGWRIVAVCP